MVNEGDYIETGVVKLILNQAIAYDETSDRAFNLIGQYPITPRTVGPVSLVGRRRAFEEVELRNSKSLIFSPRKHQYIAYLSSCMIIASKFM